MNTANVIFDKKQFDYSKTKGPFIAVPKKYWKEIVQLANKYKLGVNKSKNKRILTQKEILKSVVQAKKEFAAGKTIRL